MTQTPRHFPTTAMETVIPTKPSLITRCRIWYRVQRLNQQKDAAAADLESARRNVELWESVQFAEGDRAKRDAFVQLELARLEYLLHRRRCDCINAEIRRIEEGGVLG